MSAKIDSFTLAGLAFLGAGILLTAYVVLEPDATDAAPRAASTPEAAGVRNPTTPPTTNPQNKPVDRRQRHQAQRKPARRRQPRSGWIPAGSRESVSARALAAGTPRGAAGCSEQVDPIDLSKQIGAVVAEQIRAAGRIPSAEERALGEKLEREMPSVPRFKGKFDLPSDVATYRKYLQALVNELVQHSSRKTDIHFRVHLIRDRSFNAFALPGGVLGVHTGLLSGPNAVRDEAELMMVLGHEIAHVELRHPLAAYEAARAVLGPGADAAAVIAQMLQMPISSEYEHQADRRGMELAARSQYDPAAASRLWRRQARRGAKNNAQNRGPAGILGQILGTAERILATHPPSATRCARTRIIAQTYARSPRWTRYYRGATNLRERVPGRRAPH